jgi:hypothetical protein
MRLKEKINGKWVSTSRESRQTQIHKVFTAELTKGIEKAIEKAREEIYNPPTEIELIDDVITLIDDTK